MTRIGRPLVVAVLVVAPAAATATAYVRLRDDRTALGDRGAVTATADDECHYLYVEVDGLLLRGPGPPVAWRGRSVPGRVELDAHTGDDGVAGTFTAEDGTVIPVEGGVEGEHFFTLDCPLWSG